jgi:hypothetical protein
MRFSEMNIEKFPFSNSTQWIDFTVERLARERCERFSRQPDFKRPYDEKLAIRHHRMTIALALPERKNHGL